MAASREGKSALRKRERRTTENIDTGGVDVEEKDIEAAEMESLMDDILDPRVSVSESVGFHGAAETGRGCRGRGSTRDSRGSLTLPTSEDSNEEAHALSATQTSDSRPTMQEERRRGSSLLKGVGGDFDAGASVSLDLQEEAELGGTVVMGKAQRSSVSRTRRRSSAGRRSVVEGDGGAAGSGGGDRSRRKGSNGILERVSHGVKSAAPAVKRRSSSILRRAAAAASAAGAASAGGVPASVVPATAAAAAAATIGGAVRRASLLSVAMRSRTAAAAVAGSSYEEEAGAEADAQAIERQMSIWNLEFHDPILETAFRRHYRSWVIPRIRVGIQIQMALHLLFGSLELMCGYTEGAVMAVLYLRLAVMISLTAFSWMTLDKKFHRIMDPLALGFYTLNSLLLVAIDVAGSLSGTSATSSGLSLYFFFEGRWSLPSSLSFVVVVYHISGLRYVYSNIVAWTHYLFLWVAMVGGFCCSDGFGSFFTQSAFLVPILMVLSMISSNTVERQIRGDFILRCNISSERLRADEICASMLPARVSELLKNGSAVEDVLHECPNITILFCYITGFKELTTSCDPYDVVDFVNSLFSSFDKCTEYHHVYKLEAIDCSYLCCAGGGQEGDDENLAQPADRIWDMALSMLAVAAHGSRLPAAVGAKETGGGAVLKIGVHSGRVVGGVSGVKSYSYHLFGDAVNMASRTASTGLPGRVQLSGSAFECLSSEKQSACELRKGVAMKGKGMIDTHLASFDPEGLGQRLWRNFKRFEKMTKVYDPNFQHMGTKAKGKKGQEGGASGISSQEGKLEQIRVKKLKFTLKGSNYEDAQNAGLSAELEAEYQYQYNGSRLAHFQIFLIVAFVCVCASIYLDFYGAAPVSQGSGRITMRVSVCLLLVIILLATRDPKFVGWIQPAGAFVAVSFCITLNVLLLLVPEYHMMDMNIISLITISLLMDLQYTYVLVVNILDVVLYSIAVIVAETHEGKDVVGYLLFVYGAALIGSYACNKREREFRYTFLHKRILKDNKVKAEDLLKNMFPNLQHVRALVRGRRVVDHLDDVTIMFSDLKGYTAWASEESPKEVYRVLNKVYTAFDTHLDALGVYKLDTVGDAFVVVAGLDGFKSKEEHAMAMVKYAFRMLFELERIKTEEDLKFEMRIGLHTGPCIGGVIGRIKPRYLCWGRTPLISNELEAAGTPGKLLVSSATFAQLNKQVLVTRGLKFRPGDPLHVKTFDDMADEEVPTFFIEMDSITAFTILANEIAEDRAAARKDDDNSDDDDMSGMEEAGRGRSTLLGVNRLKRLFQGRHHRENGGSSVMFGSATKLLVGGSAGGPTRRPNRLSSSGLSMTTQSAYLASPPMSPGHNKQAPSSPTTWDATDVAELHQGTKNNVKTTSRKGLLRMENLDIVGGAPGLVPIAGAARPGQGVQQSSCTTGASGSAEFEEGGVAGKTPGSSIMSPSGRGRYRRTSSAGAPGAWGGRPRRASAVHVSGGLGRPPEYRNSVRGGRTAVAATVASAANAKGPAGATAVASARGHVAAKPPSPPLHFATPSLERNSAEDVGERDHRNLGGTAGEGRRWEGTEGAYGRGQGVGSQSVGSRWGADEDEHSQGDGDRAIGGVVQFDTRDVKSLKSNKKTEASSDKDRGLGAMETTSTNEKRGMDEEEASRTSRSNNDSGCSTGSDVRIRRGRDADRCREGSFDEARLGITRGGGVTAGEWDDEGDSKRWRSLSSGSDESEGSGNDGDRVGGREEATGDDSSKNATGYCWDDDGDVAPHARVQVRVPGSTASALETKMVTPTLAARSDRRQSKGKSNNSDGRNDDNCSSSSGESRAIEGGEDARSMFSDSDSGSDPELQAERVDDAQVCDSANTSSRRDSDSYQQWED